MQKVRPWQIVLFVAAVIGVGVSIVMFMLGDRPQLSHQVYMVDVGTGEMFSIDPSGKTIPVPSRNPATGERSLFPVAKGDDGTWKIDSRAMPMVQETRADSAGAIDLKTGVVVKVGDMKRITPRDLLKAAKAAEAG